MTVEAAFSTRDEPSLGLPCPTPDEIRALTSEAIEQANERIDAAIAAVSVAEATGVAPTFESVFGELDDAARIGAIAYGRGAAQMLTAGDDAVREAAFAANEQLEGWRAAVPMREDLARAIGQFAERADLTVLDDLQRRYLDRWQRDLRLAGAALPAAERAEVARLTNRLLEINSAFQSNLAKAPLISATSTELEGTPDVVRSAATPIEGEPDRFELPVNGGVYVGIMERAPNGDLRERAYRAWCNSGMPDNPPLMREAFELRRRLANLLGFPSWQAYRNEDLAAPSPAFVNGFIDEVATRLRPIAEREAAGMAAVMRAQPGAPADYELRDWDWRYASALQRDALGADPDRLSEYFEFDRVFDGLASLSAEVFGIRLEAAPERVGWDPTVTAFDLLDVASGRVVAHLFLDPWARTGKQPGAWTDFLLPDGGRHGVDEPPTLSLVMNAGRPAEGPTLLSVYEVSTLFHEYGHVLNFAVGHGPFTVQRGTWIPFDVIEGPSEFNGRWSLQPEVVARFARHHVTGEPIPVELLEAVGRFESLNMCTEMLRLLAQVRFDALVHGDAPISIEDAWTIASAVRNLEKVEGTFYMAAINHIMGGGYDAALYGYAWANVIRDDLLERFAAGGLVSAEMGARYRRTILDVSFLGSPLAAIEAFLGRPWSIDAFLRRASA